MKKEFDTQQFESLYEKQPSNAVWARVEEQLDEENKGAIITWRAWLSAAAVLLIGLSIWFLNQPVDTPGAEVATSMEQTNPVDDAVPVNVKEKKINEKKTIELVENSDNPVAEIAQLEEEPLELRVNQVEIISRLPVASVTEALSRERQEIQPKKISRVVQPISSLPVTEVKLEEAVAYSIPTLENKESTTAVKLQADKKPSLRFRGLTTTESALYIVKDELDHIAGDVVVAGKRKLKDFNIQL